MTFEHDTAPRKSSVQIPVSAVPSGRVGVSSVVSSVRDVRELRSAIGNRSVGRLLSRVPGASAGKSAGAQGAPVSWVDSPPPLRLMSRVALFDAMNRISDWLQSGNSTSPYASRLRALRSEMVAVAKEVTGRESFQERRAASALFSDVDPAREVDTWATFKKFTRVPAGRLRQAYLLAAEQTLEPGSAWHHDFDALDEIVRDRLPGATWPKEARRVLAEALQAQAVERAAVRAEQQRRVDRLGRMPYFARLRFEGLDERAKKWPEDLHGLWQGLAWLSLDLKDAGVDPKRRDERVFGELEGLFERQLRQADAAIQVAARRDRPQGWAATFRHNMAKAWGDPEAPWFRPDGTGHGFDQLNHLKRMMRILRQDDDPLLTVFYAVEEYYKGYRLLTDPKAKLEGMQKQAMVGMLAGLPATVARFNFLIQTVISPAVNNHLRGFVRQTMMGRSRSLGGNNGTVGPVARDFRTHLRNIILGVRTAVGGSGAEIGMPKPRPQVMAPVEPGPAPTADRPTSPYKPPDLKVPTTPTTPKPATPAPTSTAPTKRDGWSDIDAVGASFKDHDLAALERELTRVGERALSDAFEKLKRSDRIRPLTFPALLNVLGTFKAARLIRHQKVLELSGFFHSESGYLFVKGGSFHGLSSALIHELVHRIQESYRPQMTEFMQEFESHAAQRHYLQRLLVDGADPNTLPASARWLANATDGDIVAVLAKAPYNLTPPADFDAYDVVLNALAGLTRIESSGEPQSAPPKSPIKPASHGNDASGNGKDPSTHREAPQKTPGPPIPRKLTLGFANRGEVHQKVVEALSAVRTERPPGWIRVEEALLTVRQPVRGQILAKLEDVMSALQNPSLYADVLADAWRLIRNGSVADINAALTYMARASGLDVVTLDRALHAGDVFFTHVVSNPSSWIDPIFKANEHGQMTHLLQDLVVDRALGPGASGAFRALLGQATERIPQYLPTARPGAPPMLSGYALLPDSVTPLPNEVFRVRETSLAAGDYVWRFSYDLIHQEATFANWTRLPEPELLKPTLRFLGLE